MGNATPTPTIKQPRPVDLTSKHRAQQYRKYLTQKGHSRFWHFISDFLLFTTHPDQAAILSLTVNYLRLSNKDGWTTLTEKDILKLTGIKTSNQKRAISELVQMQVMKIKKSPSRQRMISIDMDEIDARIETALFKKKSETPRERLNVSPSTAQCEPINGSGRTVQTKENRPESNHPSNHSIESAQCEPINGSGRTVHRLNVSPGSAQCEPTLKTSSKTSEEFLHGSGKSLRDCAAPRLLDVGVEPQTINPEYHTIPTSTSASPRLGRSVFNIEPEWLKSSEQSHPTSDAGSFGPSGPQNGQTMTEWMNQQKEKRNAVKPLPSPKQAVLDNQVLPAQNSKQETPRYPVGNSAGNKPEDLLTKPQDERSLDKQSSQFFGSQSTDKDRKKKEQTKPTDRDERLAERIKTFSLRNGIPYTGKQTEKSANRIRLVRQESNMTSDQLDGLWTTYERKYESGETTFQIGTPGQFGDHLDKVIRMKGASKTGEVEVSQAAMKIARSLEIRCEWKHDVSDQLPQVIQKSINAIDRFLSNPPGGDLDWIVEKLGLEIGDGELFTTVWIRDHVHPSVLNWSEWNGSLESFIWSPTHRLFLSRFVRKTMISYHGDGRHIGMYMAEYKAAFGSSKDSVNEEDNANG